MRVIGGRTIWRARTATRTVDLVTATLGVADRDRAGICGAVHHPGATIGCMERVQHEAVVRDLPVGRLLAVDERGVGLRLTWRLDHGFINLSLWRGDRCVETFHLTPAEAAQLVSFIVSGLADAAPVADRVTLQAVAPISSRSFTQRARAAVTMFRELGAGILRGLADSLDQASR